MKSWPMILNIHIPINWLYFRITTTCSGFIHKSAKILNCGSLEWFIMPLVRGIPQIYYGTEILKVSAEPKRDGVIRSDFPGGWPGDSINAFTGVGLTSQQKKAQNFTRKLLNWRKDKPGIHYGKLMHFVPENGIYVYFRYDDNDKVMVILNKNSSEQVVSTDRFSEIMKGCKSGKEIISGKEISDITEITISSKISYDY